MQDAPTPQWPRPRQGPWASESPDEQVEDQFAAAASDDQPPLDPAELAGLEGDGSSYDRCPWWIRACETHVHGGEPDDYLESRLARSVHLARIKIDPIDDDEWRHRNALLKAKKVVIALPVLAAGVAGTINADSTLYWLGGAVVALVTMFGVAGFTALLSGQTGFPRVYVVVAADVVAGTLYQMFRANVESPVWQPVGSGFLVTTLTLLGSYTMLAVANALIEWWAQRQRDRIPEEALIAKVVSVGYGFDRALRSNDQPHADPSAVRDLDAAATRFYLKWPRARTTDVAFVDWQLRRWARRIVVDVRELQTLIALGGTSNNSILFRLYLTIKAIVDRDPLDDVEREIRWKRRGMYFGGRATLSWKLRRWSRIATRAILGTCAATAGAFVLASAVWRSVPQFMIDHGGKWLGNLLTFDPDVRVFAAGIGLSLLAVAQRAWTRLR